MPEGLKSPNERAKAFLSRTNKKTYQENFPERSGKYAGIRLDIGFVGDLSTSLGGVRLTYTRGEKNVIHGNISDVYTFRDNPEQDLTVSFTTTGQHSGRPLLQYFGWEGGSTITDEWMGDLEKYGFAKKFTTKINWTIQIGESRK